MKKVLVVVLFLVLITACQNISNDEFVLDNTELIHEKEDGAKECDGKTVFNFPPVNLEKTELLVPLGLMAGSHVTPVDHQYFQNFANAKPDIEVYSPADGIITSIQHMTGNNNGEKYADFRLIIEHTCSISSIYIHIDVLSSKIAEQAPERGKYSSVRIPVRAGEIIGFYQNNVDYNIVDADVILQGFIVPEHYVGEPWKIHVPETITYFNKEIQEKLVQKSIRTYKPISGKFDHDIDGAIQGNWFVQGSNGYAGGLSDYWKSHLSIAPNYLDPNHIVVSMGDYENTEKQLGVKGNTPNPSKVTTSSGIIKYELVSYDFYDVNNELWDRQTLTKIKKVKNYDQVHGVILLQLVENRLLKVEIFPNITSNEVTSFTSNAKLYVR